MSVARVHADAVLLCGTCYRLEFASVVQLDGDGPKSFTVIVNKITKMKPNMADVPYSVDKGTDSTWVFSLMYTQLDSFMPRAQEQLVMSRLPAQDRYSCLIAASVKDCCLQAMQHTAAVLLAVVAYSLTRLKPRYPSHEASHILVECTCRLELLDAAVKAREDAASFDTSRLVDFSERVVWEGPATQLSPLVREPGRLAVTDQRLYFQPLHNIAGEMVTAATSVSRRE